MISTSMFFLGIMGSAQIDACVLDVWPADRLEGAVAGSWMGGALMGVITDSGVNRNARQLQESLNTGTQNQSMMSVDLAVLFRLPAGTSVKYHNISEKGAEPVLANACSARLEIKKLIYASHPLYGKQLITEMKYVFQKAGKPVTVSNRSRVKLPKGFDPSSQDAPSVFQAALLEGVSRLSGVVAKQM